MENNQESNQENNQENIQESPKNPPKTKKKTSSNQGRNCIVKACQNFQLKMKEKEVKDDKLRFHSGPKDPKMRKKWLDILDCQDVAEGKINFVVCSEHFNITDYKTSKSVCLKDDAVPHLSKRYQIIKPEVFDIREVEKVTRLELQLQAVKNLNKRLRRIINKQQKQEVTLEEYFRMGEKWFPSELLEMWKEQGDNALKTSGRRFSDEYKKFALELYKTSPAAYRVVAFHIPMPCKASVQRIACDFKNVKPEPGTTNGETNNDEGNNDDDEGNNDNDEGNNDDDEGNDEANDETYEEVIEEVIEETPDEIYDEATDELTMATYTIETINADMIEEEEEEEEEEEMETVTVIPEATSDTEITSDVEVTDVKANVFRGMDMFLIE